MYVFTKSYNNISLIVLLYLTLHISVFIEESTADEYEELKTHKNFKLLPDDCGNSVIEDRIIGGTEAQLGQFPWLARIGYKLPHCTKKILYRCGGSIINSLYIITAAHCTVDLPTVTCPINSRNIQFIFASVAVGEYNSMTDPDCIDGVCADPVQIFKPENVLIYPSYNNPLYSGDISLVRLDRPIVFNDWVKPICMPQGPLFSDIYNGKKGFVSGWGSTDMQLPGSSQVPMVVKLPVIDVNRCENSFTKPLHLNKIRQMCAGGEKDRDSCNGDSGGPLMYVNSHTGKPRYYIIGIVSFGSKQCGRKDKPAIYTRVAGYMRWILNNIRP